MATNPKSPDPIIPPQVPDGPKFDFDAHVRTYNGFLNLLKWFCIHMAILLVGLYFTVIAGDPFLGGFLILLAIGAFAFGLLRNPAFRQDVKAAAQGADISE